VASTRKRVRADGTTVYNVRFRYADGTSSSRTFTKARHRDAFLDRLAGLRAAGVALTPEALDPQPTPPAPEALTVAGWLERWTAEILVPRAAAGGMSPRTFGGYESHVRVWLAPHLGDVVLVDLAVAHVEDLMFAVQAAGNTASTARRVRATLSAALTAAMRRELVLRNVAQLAELPKLSQRRRPSAFTDEELGRILLACREHLLGALFHVSILTGLRASELRGLKWADLDLDAGEYTVVAGRHRITRQTQQLLGLPAVTEYKPKTDGSAETTPLSPAAVEVFREHRAALLRRQLAAGPRWIATDHVFTTERGGGLDPSTVENAWADVLTAADVPAKTPEGVTRGLHEARRTFATRLRRAGIPIEEVQRLGRWASPQVLLEHYSAIDDDRLRSAAAAAADGLGDGRPTRPTPR
jgi:integrase